MSELYLRYKAISVFYKTAAETEPLVSLCEAADDVSRVEHAACVFRRVAESGCGSTGEWIQKLLERDDNVFSRAAAHGEKISAALRARVDCELLTFKQLSLIGPEKFVSDATFGFFPMFGYGGMYTNYDRLLRFYARNGCGFVAGGNAFTYRDGKLKLAECEPVSLSDLKNYAEEKAEIVRNTENFIKGLPAFHTLLYGDRGTGKSTTVKAIAHDYRDRLKIIELNKSELSALPRLFGELSGLKQRYLVFVDDLSFDEDEQSADAFKSALEGSLDGASSGNTLVYCTSNRRHLYRERGERSEKGERRTNDERQAELALFDRFGLVITYVNPDKGEFIDILKQILRSRGIKWHDEYAQIAELAALKKGGRSPRAAKQIADLIETTKFKEQTPRD